VALETVSEPPDSLALPCLGKCDNPAGARIVTHRFQNGYSTIEFYRRYEKGELGDDDDLMMWAGLYHLYLTSLPVRQFMQTKPAAA